MARTLRPASASDVAAVDSAIAHLKAARDILQNVGASKAAERVRAALSSADGAARHVRRRADNA